MLNMVQVYIVLTVTVIKTVGFIIPRNMVNLDLLEGWKHNRFGPQLSKVVERISKEKLEG